MSAWLRFYLKRFDALSARERVMLFAASFIVVVFIADAVFLSPLAKRKKNYDVTISEQRAELARLVPQIAAVKSTLDQDPDSVLKSRIQQVNTQVRDIEAKLRGAEQQLVPPEKIAQLLDEMLKKSRGLQLIAIKTLPLSAVIPDSPGASVTPTPAGQAAATPVAEPPAAAEKPDAVRQGGNIFKHGVELQLRGGYLQMLDYLKQIERSPWRIYWSKLHIDAQDRDKLTMTITLYTLSLDKTWLTL